MEQTTPDSTATGTFSIASVLSQTYATLMRNPGLFLALGLAANLPTALAEIAMIELALPEDSLAGTILPLAGMAVSMVFEGAIAYAVFMMFKGRRVSLLESIERGMVRFVPLVLCVFLSLFGTVLGLALFIIPGIALWCMWQVAVPACVVENLGSADSLTRSMDLTKGYRLKIFGLLLAAYVPSTIIVGVVIGILELTLISLSVQSGIANLVSVIPTAFISVMSVTIYHRLRTVREGVDVDALTTVFD